MRPPYQPDDDNSADRYINRVLRSRSVEAWKGLMSDDYVTQTLRVLRATSDRVAVSFAHRNGELETAKERTKAGTITQPQYAEIVAEHNEWKTRTLHFQGTVREYLRMAQERNQAVHGDDLFRGRAEALVTLAAAVVKHRADTLVEEFEPTKSDRALWAHLDLMTVPGGRGSEEKITLSELVRRFAK